MPRYMIVQADEDGNPISWLDKQDTECVENDELEQVMEDHGVTRFMDEVPKEYGGNPYFWSTGDALLLRVEIMRVRPKETVTRWMLES